MEKKKKKEEKGDKSFIAHTHVHTRITQRTSADLASTASATNAVHVSHCIGGELDLWEEQLMEISVPQ